MEMTNEMAHLTMERADTSQLKRQAMKDSMTTLLDDGLKKVAAGLTTLEEVLSVATVEQTVVE
jgi:type II secretory ATPase GspE/PulE/Tfp pilus assembly ATPase PilB-like protein